MTNSACRSASELNTSFTGDLLFTRLATGKLLDSVQLLVQPKVNLLLHKTKQILKSRSSVVFFPLARVLKLFWCDWYSHLMTLPVRLIF